MISTKAIYKIIRKILVFLWFILASTSTQSQNIDSIGVNDYESIREYLMFSSGKFKNAGIESQIYREHLGNQIFSNLNNKNNLCLIDDTTTFSLLRYSTLTPKTAYLEVNHHQRLLKSLLATIHFESNKGDGYYQNQAFRFNHLDVALFSTQSSKLRYLIKGRSLKYVQEESGGIKNDSAFIHEKKNPKLYEFSLLNSTSTTKEKSAEGYVDYNLIKQYNDFNLSPTPFELRPFADINIKKLSYLFESDSKEEYYLNNFLDTNITSDLMSVLTSTGTLGLKVINFPIFRAKYIIHSQLDYSLSKITLQQPIIDSSFWLHQIKYDITLNDSSFTKSIQLVIENNRLAELQKLNHTNVYFTANGTFFKKYKIEAGLIFQQQVPSLLDNYCLTNHFEWANDFGLTKIIKPFLKIGLLKLGLDVEYQHYFINDLIYYSPLFQPIQAYSQTQYGQVNLVYSLNREKVQMKNQLLWNTASNNDILRAPTYGLKSSLTYNLKIKGNRLVISPGINLLYYTPYKGYSYEPSLGQYYLSAEKNCGGYPFADIFVAIKITKATIKLAVDHVNSNLMERNYFLVTNYPMSGRQFKFEINWLLRN
ncbi:MAG: putative porin [Bacteroidetes bacterium]|nr:MAG: hypothetical protein UZ10_BCD003002511 [Bacteroidetes bacterium OLB10]MBV6454578.1 hypothetical protein [Bacteroidia bacterium]MBX3105401.1 hypothetical protein [Bacteroidota bacterium]MCB0849062.1 hypothetical protein [Bacteroidota bacterium]MCB8930848.1 hypothetical protein [Bacteroidia bacterium]